MTNDLVYAFDKITFQSTLLGEVQSGFNMSFVIDGTKDSARITVWSWSSVEIEPNTIIYHKNTNSWWVVSNDKMERYLNEDGMLYIHNLQLDGAIELLNARDLTDSGFNDNTYDINQFITRLFKLSTFEYTLYFGTTPDNFLSKNVDFIKTFENYTLLSALREFLDAYNMCPKLRFTTTYNSSTDTYTIVDARLDITPKTGNYSLTTHVDNDFYDIRETKTIDKNSFGTCVVSNAENVISTKAKTYPSTGSVKLSGTKVEIEPDNAILRLPSKVFKGNWIKLVRQLEVNVSGSAFDSLFSVSYYAKDVNSINLMLEKIKNKIVRGDQAFIDAFVLDFTHKMGEIYDMLDKAGCITLYENNKIIPTYNGTAEVTIEKGDDVPYLAKMSYANGKPRIPFIFTDKATKDLLPHTLQGIAWERGSDKITGFEFFSTVNPSTGYACDLESTDLQSNNTSVYSFVYEQQGQPDLDIVLTIPFNFNLSFNFSSFIVNYVPMADLKVKVDNQKDKLDIQLYNQNGKLTDNVALSKLINSYSKEISSDTITKYRQDYSYSSCPVIGSIVRINNVDYVINNISLDFSINEEISELGYLINGEYTMSKWVSTKSLMVNPNTNIRDYGIPQNYNVKRKQLYRDYYELAYSLFSDANQETPYYNWKNIFSFSKETNDNIDFIAVIKIDYDQEIGGETTWYYQLDTTTYYMNKMVYVVLDLLDNNIIGYGSQNAYSGFAIQNIYDNMTDTIVTPISYVDKDGKAKDFNVLLCSNDQITSIYNQYQIDNPDIYNTWQGCLYNYSVFIPSDIYDAALLDHEIEITETNYKKDALEVPVFEYVCQIDDSDNVLIGDNILSQHPNCIYFYSYTQNYHLTPNNVLPTNHVESVVSPVGLRISNACTFRTSQSNSSWLLFVRAKEYAIYDTTTNTWSYGSNVSFPVNCDVAIFRHAVDLTTGQVVAEELMFIAKAISSNEIQSGELRLNVNHYKLK